MWGIHDYWLFVLTGVLLNLTPGQDTFYILGRSLAQGTRAGIASALGINAGCLVHTLAAALGLSAILATSAAAFLVVKLLGAAYLVYLDVLRMLVAPPRIAGTSGAITAADAGAAFREGVLTNVLNPKVALFFLAFMPQFIDAAGGSMLPAFLVLGLTFVITGTLWCLTLALLAGRLRALFGRRPGAFALFSRAAGAVFVALGVRLAIARP